jgi:hypothetical protein
MWMFSSGKLTHKIVEESSRYTEQFLHGCKLSSRLTARAKKPVTEGEIQVVLSLLVHYSETYPEIYFVAKRIFPHQDLETL